MKVVGRGTPETLTIRLKSCEIGVIRDELGRCLTEEIAAGPAELESARAGARRETSAHERTALSRMLAMLDEPPAPGQPCEVVGPTRVLSPVVRRAAVEAAERLLAAVTAFAFRESGVTADRLRAAVDAAGAASASLIGVDYAEHHALD